MARESGFYSEAKWYVPKIDGNRDDPDPFRVLIAPLNAREMQELETSEELSKISDASRPVMSRVRLLNEGIVSKRVLDVKGYSVRNLDSGAVVFPRNGKELVDALALAAPSESEVLFDIAAAITKASRLDDGLLGKSSSRSASSPAGTAQLAAGVAASADDLTQASSQTTSAGASETATALQTSTSTAPGALTYAAPGQA